MKNLLIDLDNTVYPEDSQIFQQIDLKMKSFISENLNVTIEDAYKIQKQYFIEHGTTLRGLMLYHKIDPDLFLDYVHKIDLSSINKNETLLNLLKRYKGKKIIFTNGSLNHAIKILEKVGIQSYIDNIFDIKDADYIPKPNLITYTKVLNKFNLKASKTIMIDDLPINLKSAKDLGIKTVLIKKNIDNKAYNYIDLVSEDLVDTLIKINNEDL